MQNQLDNESSTSESNSFVGEITEKEKFADEEELKQKLQEKDDSIKGSWYSNMIILLNFYV